MIEPAAADTTFYTKELTAQQDDTLMRGITTVEYHCPICNTLVVIPYETVSDIYEEGGHYPVGTLVKRKFSL